MDFDAIFEQHYPSLVRFLHRLTDDRAAAEDAAQDAFVRLLREEPAPERPRAWLFTVGRNAVRDSARIKARRAELLEESYEPPPSPPDPERVYDRRAGAANVRRALARVPDRDREMLLLRAEGFRYREIADVCGVAPGSVGTLLARALERFRAAYGGETGQARSRRGQTDRAETDRADAEASEAT